MTGLHATFIAGPVGEAVARGVLRTAAVMHTHGGRARAIESGELHVDVAFVAAPAADSYGNVNGVDGPSACGTLGYAVADATCADWVVAVTDHLVPIRPVQSRSVRTTSTSSFRSTPSAIHRG